MGTAPRPRLQQSAQRHHSYHTAESHGVLQYLKLQTTNWDANAMEDQQSPPYQHIVQQRKHLAMIGTTNTHHYHPPIHNIDLSHCFVLWARILSPTPTTTKPLIHLEVLTIYKSGTNCQPVRIKNMNLGTAGSRLSLKLTAYKMETVIPGSGA